MKTVEKCYFEEIYDVWDKELWPNRVSAIEERSALQWNSDLWLSWGNIKIIKNRKEIWQYPATFWKVTDGDIIVGVNSGFMTSESNHIYRSRGLWIHEDYRGYGLSTQLLNATIEQAKEEKCSYIWTMPRKTALVAYNKVGFNMIGDWFDEGVEFGPNCLAIMKLL